MNKKPNILVVCGRNKKRSRTAEYIFKNDSRFNIRSAGFGKSSNIKISDKDIIWADIILVMEQGQSARIKGCFRHLQLPDIEILHIEDDYEYLDPELIGLLRDRINNTIKYVFKIE